MIRHVAQNLLAVVCGFGTLTVIGSILHQESQARLKRLRPNLPAVRPRQTIAATQPRPVQPEPEMLKSVAPQISEVPQPSPASPDDRPANRKTREEREGLRAERAEKRARREAKMARRAQGQQTQSP